MMTKRQTKRALASAERRIRRAVREANATRGIALGCPIVDAAIAARDALLGTSAGARIERDSTRRLRRAQQRAEDALYDDHDI